MLPFETEEMSHDHGFDYSYIKGCLVLHDRDEEREAQRIDELRRDARRRQEAAVAAQDEQADERKVRDSGMASNEFDFFRS